MLVPVHWVGSLHPTSIYLDACEHKQELLDVVSVDARLLSGRDVLIGTIRVLAPSVARFGSPLRLLSVYSSHTNLLFPAVSEIASCAGCWLRCCVQARLCAKAIVCSCDHSSLTCVHFESLNHISCVCQSLQFWVAVVAFNA
jgi:hypothetical protein